MWADPASPLHPRAYDRFEDLRTMHSNDPTCSQTPDGTYLFEHTFADGRRFVAVVLPEDVDEIAGPPSAAPGPDEKRRRYQVARLLADAEIASQSDA